LLTTGLKNKLKATFEIEQCWIFVVLWWPFWKWRPVEIFQCRNQFGTSLSTHSDRSPLEEHFCIFKIFEMSAIFKMAAKTRHKIWAVKIQHCPTPLNPSKYDFDPLYHKAENFRTN
jgi:hypothetical protein